MAEVCVRAVGDGLEMWWRLTPRDVRIGDVVDLSDIHITPPSRVDLYNAAWHWTICHITMEGPGLLRIGFLPVLSGGGRTLGRGGQVDLRYHHTDRLRVKR